LRRDDPARTSTAAARARRRDYIAPRNILASAGQFVAALRSPRTFAVALAFAVGAVVVIVVGTPIRYQILDWVNVPLAWLDALPDWDSLLVAVPSLALAVASLMIAVLLPFGSRRTGAKGAAGKGPGLTCR
jgi:hypothetical protein